MNSPLISVVTVTFNNLLGLKKTIDSVKNQGYQNIQFIIIDGASEDGTKDFLDSSISFSDWISEPDLGIYDAMNKGLVLSRGDFVIFLNAGDVFFSNNTINDCFLNVYDFNLLYFGRAVIESNSTNWIYPSRFINSKNISFWLKNNLPNHQAIFFPRSFYSFHNYNLIFKISSDADYKLRALNNLNYQFLDIKITKFKLGGISSTFNSFTKYKQLSKESWTIDSTYYSLFKSMKNQFVLILKFILFFLFRSEGYYKFINFFK